MLKSIIFLLVGFLLLVKGADWFVEGASSARRLRIPSFNYRTYYCSIWNQRTGACSKYYCCYKGE